MSGVAWLFDLGNSRLKAAWSAGDGLAGRAALAWDAGDAAALRGAIATWPSPSRICVASVVDARRNDALCAALPPDAPVEWLRSPAAACGVSNHYRRPERLGIDRFLAMVALRARGRSGVIAGCGTALTIDVVDAAGVHSDGAIAPSPMAMLAALDQTTTIASGNADAFAGVDADDTARALHAGCWGAALALVERYVARHAPTDDEPALWLHGGWSGPLGQALARDGIAHGFLDDAVLHGLAVWVTTHPIS